MTEPVIVNLWPDGSTHNPVDPNERPRIEVYQPAASSAMPKPAVVICPGGGYVGRAPHEGEPFARLFAAHGLVGIVCHYRVSPHYFPAPMADAARAMRMVRRLAPRFGVDPGRVAIMGFSAGGHLACTTATQPDLYCDPQDDLAPHYSARPDRVILAYPVVSMLEGLCAENLLGKGASQEQWRQMSNESGPHGVGMAADLPRLASWTGLLLTWLSGWE